MIILSGKSEWVVVLGLDHNDCDIIREENIIRVSIMWNVENYIFYIFYFYVFLIWDWKIHSNGWYAFLFASPIFQVNRGGKLGYIY